MFPAWQLLICHSPSWPHLQSRSVPARSIIECPGSVEEKHDGDKGIENHREDQRDEVEQSDVDGEHYKVHGRVSWQAESTFWHLITNTDVEPSCPHFTIPNPLMHLVLMCASTSQGELQLLILILAFTKLFWLMVICRHHGDIKVKSDWFLWEHSLHTLLSFTKTTSNKGRTAAFSHIPTQLPYSVRNKGRRFDFKNENIFPLLK